MFRTFPLTLAVLACLATTAACGGGGGGSGGGGSAADDGGHVDAGHGDDTTGDGSSKHPFKTITRGVSAAGFGETIHVAAGTYDAANGEFFPILPGIGATIVGAESPNPLGGIIRRTHVVGGGFWSGDVDGRLHATIVPTVDCHIVGMTFENAQPFVIGGAKPAAVVLANPRVHLESCGFQNSDKGMRLVAGANDDWITGCSFTGNNIGVFVDGATGDNRFEDCLVTGNSTGVMLFTPGADFGGDLSASSGGNVFAANTVGNDFVNACGAGVTIYAAWCFWDHSPATYTGGSNPDPAADIWLLDVSSNVVSGDAQVYDPNNPPPAHP